MGNETPLRSRRKNARYGTKTEMAGQPVMLVKSGKKEDYVTPEELFEDLYGRPVDHIVFRDSSASSIPAITH